MSHFRLKRRVRRAVNSLSLIFTAAAFLRRTDLPHPAASGWHSGHGDRPWRPRLLRSRRHRFFKLRFRFEHRRYLTVMLALLAFSLEVCGCDLARDAGSLLGASDGVRTARSVAMPEERLSFYVGVSGPQDVSPEPAMGGGPPPPVRTPTSQAKPLPWAIPESVFFVFKSGEGDVAEPDRQPIATAFVLSVPDREHRRAYRFLVTARHVVDPQWAGCGDRNPESVDLRLNRRVGGVAYENIALDSGQRRRFFTPADPAADLAIIPLDQKLIPNLNDYKFLDVPFRLLPTDSETSQFHSEQPVMTARVPSWPSSGSGDYRGGNYPVFDSGVLAKMPAESVDVQCGDSSRRQRTPKPLHVWFIDAGVAQRASGAPVYTVIARGASGVKAPVLLGVQSVAWPDAGAAGITPSSVLGELIESYLRERDLRTDLYQGPGPWAKECAPSLY